MLVDHRNSIYYLYRVSDVEDIHLTGIACMFLASKYVDCYPLAMDVVFNKIGHKEFPIVNIKQKELDIMRVLSFYITFPTILDFFELEATYLMTIGYSTDKIRKLVGLGIFIAKMMCYDYTFLSYK